MSTTRRNHYRTLHVQPEAPVEVITASHQALMQKLKGQPDPGGDPLTAERLDQAYAVLSDPDRRAHYDAELRRAGRLHGGGRSDGPAGADGGRTPARAAAARSAAGRGGAGTLPSGARSTARPGQCAWCGEPAPSPLRPDSRCHRCESPLSPLRRGQDKHDLFGRRHAQRVARSSAVALFVQWGEPACSARLRDLSITGFSALTDVRLPDGQTVRLTDAGMDLLAVVVGCRRDGRHWVVHARATHLAFGRRGGTSGVTGA